MSYCDTPFEVRILKTTDKSALCEFTEFEDLEEWVPFSQIEDNGEDLQEGEECAIYITEWFAKKIGVY